MLTDTEQPVTLVFISGVYNAGNFTFLSQLTVTWTTNTDSDASDVKRPGFNSAVKASPSFFSLLGPNSTLCAGVVFTLGL